MTQYSNYKDFALRKNIKLKQSDIFIFKSFLLNKKISKKIRFKIMLKMHLLYNILLGNRSKNRCIFSTKIRSVSRLTNLTKTSFRENLQWGKINGFKKASW